MQPVTGNGGDGYEEAPIPRRGAPDDDAWVRMPGWPSRDTFERRDREYKPWGEIEAEAEEAEAKALETICIWCGKDCGTLEQLEVHEDECA